MNYNELLAIRWLDAFNAHDLESLLALYHDDAEHYSPKLKQHLPDTMGLIRGKDALRSWWQDALDRLPSLHYRLFRLTSGHERVFMEYIRTVDGAEDMAVAEVLSVLDGRIASSRVYHG